MFKQCCFVVAAGLWHYTLKKSRLSTRTSSYMLLFSPFLCFSLTITAYFTTQLSYTACHFLCYLSSSEIPVYSKYIVHNFVDWCCADICHWQKGLFNSSVMYKLHLWIPSLVFWPWLGPQVLSMCYSSGFEVGSAFSRSLWSSLGCLEGCPNDADSSCTSAPTEPRSSGPV